MSSFFRDTSYEFFQRELPERGKGNRIPDLRSLRSYQKRKESGVSVNIGSLLLTGSPSSNEPVACTPFQQVDIGRHYKHRGMG